jgi:hypothetical protein
MKSPNDAADRYVTFSNLLPTSPLEAKSVELSGINHIKPLPNTPLTIPYLRLRQDTKFSPQYKKIKFVGTSF